MSLTTNEWPNPYGPLMEVDLAICCHTSPCSSGNISPATCSRQLLVVIAIGSLCVLELLSCSNTVGKGAEVEYQSTSEWLNWGWFEHGRSWITKGVAHTSFYPHFLALTGPIPLFGLTQGEKRTWTYTSKIVGISPRQSIGD